MENRLFVPKYFAGAFSGDGFKNHLSDSISGMKKIYIIKGTPGSGKSTLMKKIAEALTEIGFDVEYIYCSSDPSSLDGIVCPAISFAMVDGTSPHVMEASYPIAVETIINTGDFIKHSEVEKHRDEIISLADRKKELFSLAGKLLRSACELRRIQYTIAEKCYNSKKGFDFCRNIILKEKKLQTEYLKQSNSAWTISENESKACITNRSFFAFGKDGISALDSFPTSKKISVNKTFTPFILGTMKLLLPEYKIYAICANNPLDVSHTALIHFPFSNTTFVDSAFVTTGDFKNSHISSVGKARFSSDNALKENKEKLSFLQKTEKLILEEAKAYLKEAMDYHKSLEKIYVSSLNKDGINCLTRSLIVSLLGE